jgi:single-strand DNA-binding protein
MSDENTKKMHRQDTNVVVLTGNLTRDVDLYKPEDAGTAVANMRIAVNGRRKVGGVWVDKPNYFTVVDFGVSAENHARYLKKGRLIHVDGRLDWDEYEKNGETRHEVKVIASNVQYLPTKASLEEARAAAAASAQGELGVEQPGGQAPAEPEGDREPVGAVAGLGDEPEF